MAPRDLAAPPRLDGEGATDVVGTLLWRQGELVRRLAYAQQQVRIGGEAKAPGDQTRELPSLVVAALAQAGGAERHRHQQRRRIDVLAHRFVGDGGREDGTEVEAVVKLEVGDELVPRRAVVDAGQGGIERWWRCLAGAADQSRRGRWQRTAAATRHDGGEAAEAGGTDTASAPAAADRAQAGPSGSGRARCGHRLNILPPMAADDRSNDDRDRAGKSARALDEVAVGRALRRIASTAKPPWLHEEIARRLGERLGPMRIEPSRILDWWPGIGAGAPVLRAAYPRAVRVAVEPSATRIDASVSTAKTRPWWSLSRTGRTPVFDDAASDAGLGHAQLVWANMALHFVADPPALFARWHGLLDVEGLVVFSCPGPGTLRELRSLYADCGWPAPTPGYIDMHDLGDMLVRAGFADPVLDQETLNLRWKSAEALLAELHQLGGNTAPGRVAGLRTPAWRRRLLAALSERADADGSIAMGIEVAYGHGFKAAPRKRAGEPVSVPLETMRAMVKRRRP